MRAGTVEAFSTRAVTPSRAEAQAMQGTLNFEWGWREYARAGQEHRAFYWMSLNADFVLVQASFEIGVGVEGFGFELGQWTWPEESHDEPDRIPRSEVEAVFEDTFGAGWVVLGGTTSACASMAARKKSSRTGDGRIRGSPTMTGGQ